MNILGLNFDHDSSACIIKNGKLISAVSSERIHRIKKFAGITSSVINYVLNDSGLTLKDIDVIALSDYYVEKNHGVLKLYSKDDNSQIKSTRQTVFDNNVIEYFGEIMGHSIPVIVVPHHTSHAASAYYTSNFDDAWCFTMDSSFGDVRSNSCISKGIGNNLFVFNYPGMMIGVGYGIFTERIGLGRQLFKAGSTMGLASYGKPNSSVLKNLSSYMDGSYFNIEDSERSYIDYFDKLWYEISNTKEYILQTKSSSKLAQEIAASIQYLFENCVLDVIENKIPKDFSKNLCLAGGSFLNCNANSFIKNNSRFNNIHHFPACGDDGNAVGSALYVAHHIFNEPRHVYKEKELCYTGKDYEIIEPDYKEIASQIANGKIVAWFMGKSEYGPRALGNRSILADPRNFHNREKLNFVIKKREWFRPFAPVVLEEKSSEWFDFDGPSPFMLYTSKVLKPELIPAVTHVDNTARHQTINEETNKHYYNLIKEFDKITGVPVLINTSLNADSEPILETEEDAIAFFNNSDIDILVLNGKILIK